MDNGRSNSTAAMQAPSGLARDVALNQMYGTAITRLSPAQFKAIYNDGGGRLEPQELAAMVARGQSLNAQGQSLNAQDGGSLAYPYVKASSQPYHAVMTVRPDANGPDGIMKADQTPSAAATVRPDANGPDGLDKTTQIPSATVATVRPNDELDRTTQLATANATGGDGFDWDSLAIGGGTLAFIALLAIGSYVVTRR